VLDALRGVVDDSIELSSSISDNPAFIVLTDREREGLFQLAGGSQEGGRNPPSLQIPTATALPSGVSDAHLRLPLMGKCHGFP
jgi:hypothetical protein